MVDLSDVIDKAHWLAYTTSKVGKDHTIAKFAVQHVAHDEGMSKSGVHLPEIYDGDIFRRPFGLGSATVSESVWVMGKRGLAPDQIRQLHRAP